MVTTPEDDLRAPLQELAAIVERVVTEGDGHLHHGPVWAMRWTTPTEPDHAMYAPMLCVVAQGAKQLLVGDERFVYDAGRFLLNSVTVPAAGGVIEATPARPCLWTMIELDPATVGEVAVEAGLTGSRTEDSLPAMESSRIDRPLLDAVIRVARLFETPADAEFLRPLLMREIVYRLLTGNQAARLRQIVALGGETNRVVRAVEWLRRNFDQPIAIDDLAKEAGLSPSALHHHFKRVTTMSPLQYQRQMRLQEAKRLMVGEGLDAGTAGVRVGYDDPSYFSREYRRFFGDPPRRHVARVRSEVAS